MRPLNLTFSGLNSYAAKAEIDFTDFFKDRIFGIFGDTGAGKSTIIDAITYALFGKIDRVGNEIKTAINPKTKKTSVSFTFKIGGKVYRVSRILTQRKTEASLYEIDGANIIPIAEKTKDVNEKISRLIGGFEYDEFTKIIALPQNKFSEFLTAKPADRAALLEKIFGLEIYGDRLWVRLTDKEKHISSELTSINTILEQLSDVSEDQLKQKTHRINSIEELRKKEQELLKTKEAELYELKELKKLAADRAKIENEKEKTLARKPEMEDTKIRIENAQKVAPFRRDLENMDYWEKEIRIADKNIASSEFNLDFLNIELLGIKEEEKAFEEKRSSREKEIAVSKKSAQEAIALKDKIKEMTKRLKDKQTALFNIEKQLQEKTDEYKNLADSKSLCEKKRNKLKEDKKTIELDADEQALYTQLQEIEKEIGAVKEIETTLSKEKKKLESLLISIDESTQKILKTWNMHLSNITLTDIEKADDVLVSLEDETQNRIDALISKIHGLELLGFASRLAEELIEGSPCPVCGSTVHPSPAIKPPDEDMILSQKDLDGERDFLKTIRALKDEIKPSIKSLKDYIILKNTIESNIKDLDVRKKDILDAIRARTRLEIDSCETLKKGFDERIKKQTKIQISIDKAQKELDDIISSIGGLQAQIENMRVEKSKLQEEIRQVADNISEYEKKIKDLIAEKDPEKLLAILSKEENALKEKADALKKSISKKQDEIQRLSNFLSGEKSRKEEMEKKLKESMDRINKELIILQITEEEFRSYMLEDKEIKRFQKEIETYENRLIELEARLKEINGRIKTLKVSYQDDVIINKAEKEVKELKEKIDAYTHEIGELTSDIKKIEENLVRKKELLSRKKEKEKEDRAIKTLKDLLKGKDFVHFIVRELGKNIVRLASDAFSLLTNERMSLRLAEEKFNFYIDDHTTGNERPVDTLSGGEIFLASFSLALALSRHIQTMKARSIKFFFIDEGFGTLDDETLSAVAGVMDRLRNEDVLVGFITHRKELKELVSHQIVVTKSGGDGSRIKVVV
ncbi:MAG TPA: AAA family ATPase [Syntrophorhabdaceae bacterium]|nr:AAA family ATPase [Syntrophorhabdaceae bacterium]